jgi:hypothetical protein
MSSKFYMAMMECDVEKVNEQQALRLLAAMEELKSAVAGFGKVTYYEIKYEYQYRKAEHELKAAADNA